eukprot:CAMPEP_0202946330 /NCGR_PEP_ID=MMETSP1395-20130829/9144_1 /ASSEMBLY_ACC=CAM_ASM_000871 /TAXON_ID=5961 /ORGANISM="Blepharisma japonicum, Strain Stock R1072" /LENGTH=397 /DNA_ID=CAMNT_0049646863 /DNA_START=164 /DNA_END=1357 /DNA_ORIENTATION=-
MTQGTIVKWLKKEGDKIKAGEIMFEVETDKATLGFEVQDDVYLAKIIEPEGSANIPLGKPVAILVDSSGDVAAFKNYSPTQENVAPEKIKAEVKEVKAPIKEEPKESPIISDRVFISPLAKKISKENNFDYTKVAGTGPHGRIVKDDIIQALSATPQPEPTIQTPQETRAEGFKDIPHSSIRKVIAKRLLESKLTIPHYYLSIDCATDTLNAFRAKLNALSPVKISINDIIIKATALASLQVPEANAVLTREFNDNDDNVDVSVAVQTDKGLITPIVKNAHIKRIGEISAEMKKLADLAKTGKLTPDQFQGGTITVSNLGMFGIKEFSAIINPPQACILAVGASHDVLVPDAEKGFKASSVMTVTLSCDHRVVDGAIGARWLQSFKKYIEEPYSMLI